MTSAMLSAESDLGHLDLELAMGGLTLEEGDRGGIDMDGSRVGNMVSLKHFSLFHHFLTMLAQWW